MTNPTLYQLCGLPFAGKTTLTKELVKRFNLHTSSVDDTIKKHNLHVSDMTQDDWNFVYAEAYEDLKNALKSGKSVILDKGSLKQSERDTARTIAKEIGADYKLIYIDTPLEEIQTRRKRNEETKERGGLDDTYFQIALEQFVPPSNDEKHVIFNKSMDLDQWIEQNIG